MLGARIGRRKQQEDEIDRHVVDRGELDRLGELGEQADDPVEPGHFAVRDRHAAAEAGRAQPLALCQSLGDMACVEPELAFGQPGQRLEQRLLRWPPSGYGRRPREAGCR